MLTTERSDCLKLAIHLAIFIKQRTFMALTVMSKYIGKQMLVLDISTGI